MIHLKTDSNFLFTYTSYVVETNKLNRLDYTVDLYNDVQENKTLVEAASIQTYYESMWMERGIPIKYMRFQLPHEGLLIEPDVEIELDSYRSYHRDKRSTRETHN